MRHLTPADYIRQPWKNGRGLTTELWRVDAADGSMLARLSRASLVEDGPFSLFPGIERSLTVLCGPGFRISGEGLSLRCDLLVPVAFPGDLPVEASESGGRQSDDFNVMTARNLPRPEVTVEHDGSDLPPGGLLALYAVGPVTVNGTDMAEGDLILTETGAQLRGRGPVIAARLFGLTP